MNYTPPAAPWRRITPVLMLLLVVGGLYHTARPLYAATLGLTIDKLQDGGIAGALNSVGDTANGVNVCPSNPSPGCDYGADDDIVRTHDQVSYRINYNINPPVDPAEEIIITSTLPEHFSWNLLPGSCTGAGSGISADGRTLTCNLGTFSSATTANFDVLVDVGGVANGTVLDFDAVIGGNASTQATANAPDVTITAAPRYDIRKTSFPLSVLEHNGVLGFSMNYFLDLWVLDENGTINPVLGAEPLVDTLTLVDDVSGLTANTELVECRNMNYPVAPSAAATGRAWGRLGMNVDAVAANSVVDAGTIACSQPGGPGTNVNITLSGVDSTLDNVPTEDRNGNTFAASEQYAGSYNVRLFVPATDVTAAGGELSVTNCYSGFDPLSISGQSNFGAAAEDTGNNCHTRTLVTASGGFIKDFIGALGEIPSNGDFAGTATGFKSGDGLVTPGEVWAVRLTHSNNGIVDLNNIVMCDVIDNSKYVLTGGTDTQFNYFDNGGAAVFEYATGYVGSWPPDPLTGDAAAVNAECADPGITWIDSTAYTGALADVTKWRVRLLDPLAPGERADAWAEVQALEIDPTTGTAIPNGTTLANYATRAVDEFNGGAYATNNYVPGAYPTPTHTNTGYGDRLALARGIVRIGKEGSVDAVNAGNVMNWTLTPTFTSDGNPYSAPVTVVDVLPPALSYQVGSASAAPGQIIACTGAAAPHSNCTQAGETVLVWDLGALTTNDPIASITFSTLVSAATPNNTVVTNRTVISSPADPSPESDRDATDTVLVQAPAVLLAAKTVQTPLRLPDEPLQFTLSLYNNTADPLTNLDMIDVLPWNGDGSVGPFGTAPDDYPDGRTPPSAYTGALDFSSASLPSGATMYYSKDAPATIDRAPVHLTLGAANTNDLASGSTNWCPGIDGSTVNPAATPTHGAGSSADCPATTAEVTAYRIVWPGPLAAGGGSVSVVLALDTNGNAEDDLYTNNFGVRADEISLPALSNDVSALVVAPSVGDTVWAEFDGNGIRNAGDIMLAGVTVTLTGTDRDGNPVDLETTTDANGAYLFDVAGFGLRPSNAAGYTVTIDPSTNTTLPGVALTPAYDLDDGTGPFSTPRSSGPVVLNAGDDRTDVDFGLSVTPVTIGDLVWNDVDQDGFIDAGEPGIANVTVNLVNSAGVIVMSTTTDGNGAYTFTAAPGSYKVQIDGSEFAPSGDLYGFLASPLNNDSVGDPNTNAYELTLAEGAVDNEVDFGFYASGKLTLGNYVWKDVNLDGDHNTVDEAEFAAGIDGVRINVYRDRDGSGTLTPGDTLWATTTTGDDPGTPSTTERGWYGVPVVDNLAYLVEVDARNFDPGGPLEHFVFTNGYGATYLDTNPQYALVSTTNVETVDFGYAPVMSLGSWIWRDDNSNGLQNPGIGESGIEGATVSLLVDDGAGNFVAATDIANAPVADQVTLADGLYFFTNLPEGRYKIRVTMPAGYVPSPVQNTTDDNDTLNDSNIAGNPSSGVYESIALTLVAGAEPTEGTLRGDAQDNAAETNGNMSLDMGFVQYDLALIKTVALGQTQPISQGDVITYHITVKNQGGASSGAFCVSDQFPEGMSYVNLTTLTSFGGGFYFQGFDAPNVLRWCSDNNVSGGTEIPPGEVAIYALALQVDDANLAGPYRNFAEISEDSNDDRDSTPDADFGNDPVIDHDNIDHDDPAYDERTEDEDDHDYADVTVLPAPELAIEKVLNTPEPVRSGDAVSFTIRITNTGPTTIEVLPLEDAYDTDYLIFTGATPQTDDNLHDGVLNWADLTDNDPRGFGSDLAPNGVVEVVVEFVGLRDTSGLPGQATINTAAVENAVDENGNTPPLAEDDAPVTILAPTGVYFADRDARRSGAVVNLRWTTLDETTIAAFRVLRTNSDGTEVVLTADAIVAAFAGQAQGNAYAFTDTDLAGQSTVHYDLEVVGLDGSVTRLDLGRVHAGATSYLPLVTR